MKIFEVKTNDKNLLKLIASPVAYLQSGFPLSYEIDECYVDELDKRLLNTNFVILTHLAKLYFYFLNIDAYGNSSSNFVLSKFEFETNKDLLHLIFKYVVAANLYTERRQDEWIYISVSGITSIGEKILKCLIKENKMPDELKVLYVNKNISNDATVGLYKITEGYQTEESDFLFNLNKDKYNNSLDISALSLSECTNNKICNYIVANKKNVYIYVNSACNGNFNIKHLIWH